MRYQCIFHKEMKINLELPAKQRQWKEIGNLDLRVDQYLLGHDHWHTDVLLLHVVKNLFKHFARFFIHTLYFLGKYRIECCFADLFDLFGYFAHGYFYATLFKQGSKFSY